MTESSDASNGPLAGKVAIVTGSGSGIGAAVARKLAARGAKVVVADISADAGRNVADEIASGGAQAVAACVDVSTEDGAAAMVAAAVDTFGRLDVLHNNAAATSADVLGRDGDIVGTDPQVWDITMAVNLRGPMLGSKHAIPVMIGNGGGVIVNTVSPAAQAGDLRFSAYASSKAGLVALTQHIATQYGKAGIRCNAISPGMILTPNAIAALSEEIVETAKRHHLTPRVGYPEDIANAVAFLASDDATFITGHVLCVDGGVSCHQAHYADTFVQLGLG
jgi:NAD(P)-dependent dehydrogenase (short-subunit alcohol dehydrogenase family)